MPTSYFSPRRAPKPHMLHNYTAAGAQHITPGLQCVVQMSHRLFLALFAICSVAVFFFFVLFILSMLKIPAVICLVTVVALPS